MIEYEKRRLRQIASNAKNQIEATRILSKVGLPDPEEFAYGSEEEEIRERQAEAARKTEEKRIIKENKEYLRRSGIWKVLRDARKILDKSFHDAEVRINTTDKLTPSVWLTWNYRQPPKDADPWVYDADMVQIGIEREGHYGEGQIKGLSIEGSDYVIIDRPNEFNLGQYINNAIQKPGLLRRHDNKGVSRRIGHFVHKITL